MVSDREQMRFYYSGPRTRDEAREWIDRNLSLYDEHGYGFWLIEMRKGSEFLGYCGVRPLVLDGVSQTEIGWHTTKAWWGRGIATEAAAAVRHVALGQLGLPKLIALVHPGHVASRRVAEKIGMREEEEVELDGHSYAAYILRRSAP
jgi:RimJ/RimL family protein N-acetyltransferase